MYDKRNANHGFNSLLNQEAFLEICCLVSCFVTSFAENNCETATNFSINPGFWAAYNISPYRHIQTIHLKWNCWLKLNYCFHLRLFNDIILLQENAMCHARQLTSDLCAVGKKMFIQTQTLAEAFTCLLFGTEQTRHYFLIEETSDRTNFRQIGQHCCKPTAG